MKKYNMLYIFHQGSFLIKHRYFFRIIGTLRALYYSILGMKIGKGTFLPSLKITWPHQVQLGKFCKLESGTSFKFDGIWQDKASIIISDHVFIGSNCEFNIREGIYIGKNTLVASGCKFIDHDHGISLKTTMKDQQGIEKSIRIGEDVWLGVNVVILKGVQVGKGAILAAGSVVTKSIPTNEIWAGIPAKKIGDRQ